MKRRRSEFSRIELASRLAESTFETDPDRLPPDPSLVRGPFDVIGIAAFTLRTIVLAPIWLVCSVGLLMAGRPVRSILRRESDEEIAFAFLVRDYGFRFAGIRALGGTIATFKSPSMAVQIYHGLDEECRIVFCLLQGGYVPPTSVMPEPTATSARFLLPDLMSLRHASAAETEALAQASRPGKIRFPILAELTRKYAHDFLRGDIRMLPALQEIVDARDSRVVEWNDRLSRELGFAKRGSLHVGSNSSEGNPRVPSA